MAESINAFPGYEYKRLEDGKYHNMYRGVDLGKGGWVYTDPGIYSNVALLDVASLHPHSIVELNKLGEYTQNYKDLLDARVYIKHKEYDKVKDLFGGRLSKYLESKEEAKALSKALKLPLNAFFGISFASFPNPARDSRDINNIIALRGALFMKTLFDEVESRGFHIIHVKTDSIKVPEADIDIIRFIQSFAKKYGYEMEHEATYERMCLIDKAQYIASYMQPEECVKRYGYTPEENVDYISENGYTWTATGDEFKRPFIFKAMFSGEPYEFDDMCITNTVKDAAIYLDMNENLKPQPEAEKEMTRRIFNAANPEKPMKLNPAFSDMSDEEVNDIIGLAHNYQFIGRVGRFCPIKPGAGGGILLAYRREKYDAVSGSKGYRWLEAEVVKELGKENELDQLYFDEQCQDAIAAINKFGDYDRFIDLSRPYIYQEPVDRNERELIVPCGDGKYNTCMECPNCVGDICRRGYTLNAYIEKGGDGDDA